MVGALEDYERREWEMIRTAVLGNGTDANPGLVQKFHVFETKVVTTANTIKWLLGFVLTLLLVIIGYLTYLGQNRTSALMSVKPDTTTVSYYSEMK